MSGINIFNYSLNGDALAILLDLGCGLLEKRIVKKLFQPITIIPLVYFGS